MNALAKIHSMTPADVFVANGADPILEEIRKEIADFVPDVTTVKGRKEIKSFAYKVAQSKTFMEDAGKALTADIDATRKVVLAERKRVREQLEEWRDDIRQPVTDYENAEKALSKFLQECLDELGTWGNMPTGSTVQAIETRIGEVSETPVNDAWGELEGLAQTTKEKVLEHLQERLADRQTYEDQQEELAALRIDKEKAEAETARLERERQAAEEERLEDERRKRDAARAEEDRIEVERQRVEREERMTKEAADRATAQAEEKAREEKERHERETQEALDREALAIKQRDEAAENERNRIAAEKLAEDEAAKEREENKRHRGTINRRAKKALIEAGLSEDDAQKAVEAIAKGDVPNVKISY